MNKKTIFPLERMLGHKGEDFSSMFVKTINLYLANIPGKELSDKDKMGRIRKLIEEYSKNI